MKASTARSFIYLSLADFSFMLAGYFIHFALGRLWRPEDYGILGVITTIFTLAMLIFNGTSLATSKFISENEKKAKYIRSISIVIQLSIVIIISLIFGFLASSISSLLKDKSLIPLIRLCIILFPFYGLFGIYQNYFNGLRLFKKQALTKMILSAFKAISVLSLGILLKVKGAVIGYAVAPAAACLAATILDPYKKRKEDKKEDKKTRFDDAKRIIKFAFPISIFAISYHFFINIDLLMVKSLMQNDYLTGFYNAVITVGRIPYFLLASLALILFPTISKITAHKDYQEARKVIAQSLRFVLILIVPGVLFISSTSKSLLEFLYSKKYLEAAPVLSVFVLGVGFLFIFFIFTSILNGAKKEKISMTLALVGLLTGFILNLILIPKFGLFGAAYSTIISAAFVLILATIAILKEFGKIISPILVFKIGVCATVVYLISLFFTTNIISLIPFYLALFLLYFTLLYLFKAVTREDVKIIKDLLRFK